MKVFFESLLPGAQRARGIAVIIDVFRAFTCAPLLFALGIEKSILVATDPVALDRILLESIETLRQAEKLEPLTPMSEHVKIAGELGLGEYDREKINLVKINLG